jgi:BirA family biotin operon repressor/biotin-[acetyl-CoA-carboxylase] ligase
LNVNWKPEDGVDMRYPAVSISDVTGTVIQRDKIVSVILSRLDSYCRAVSEGRFEVLYELWCGRSVILGKSIEVDTGQKIISGKVLGFDRLGAVMLKDVEGKEHKFHYGDVSLKEIKQ